MFTSQNLTLLYIEDDGQIRENISDFLRENGLGVIETEDTLKACDLFRTNKVDIILTDLLLPHQNGMEFIRCLRDKEVQTPIVITTAYTDKEFLLDAINLDVTRYLVKPFKKNELLNALKIAIQKLFTYKVQTFTHLHNNFSYDPINKSIIDPNGNAIQLSKKEYLLIELLLTQKGKIFSYEIIETVVWENSPMSMDSLRTLVLGIRKKTYPNIITNNNGIGYKIDL